MEIKNILERLLLVCSNNNNNNNNDDESLQKENGIPVVAAYFNNYEKDVSIARNTKQKEISCNHSHAEFIALEDSKNKDTLIVTIIPCEKCLEEILLNKNIKNIYYIGDYKEFVKYEKYDEKNIDWKGKIKIQQFIPSTIEEYKLTKKIYYHFVVCLFVHWIPRFIEKITKLGREEIEIEKNKLSYTFLKILTKLSNGAVKEDLKRNVFLIDFKKLDKWWMWIKKLNKKNGELFNHLMNFDFGIKEPESY